MHIKGPVNVIEEEKKRTYLSYTFSPCMQTQLINYKLKED
jgi:hypothetical protein